MRQYYYLHIPKTAGTSLGNIIEAQFLQEQINHEYNSLANIGKMDAKEFAEYRLIRGHFTYSLVEKFQSFPHIITMLRHPVERTLSHLLHVKNIPSFWLHKYVPLTTEPLEEVLEYEETKKFICNHQLRLIGYDFNLNHVKEPKMFYVPYEADEALFNTACRRLTTCEFVGIAERFTESVELLCSIFYWGRVTHIPKLNMRTCKSQDDKVSDEIVQRILDLNTFEMKFYDFACKLFEERLASMRSSNV